MRQYGELPPWLAANNTPAVASVTGMAGAGVQTPDSGGFGDISIQIGPGGGRPDHTWSIVLAFPNTPPTLFLAGDEQLGTITQSTTGNNVTISGAGAAFLPFSNYRLHYEWSVSK
jgi:hypothetical protein